MQPTATPRQLEILRLIRDYRRQHGYSPTMQEIGDSLHLSKVTVFEHVSALEKKGLLLRGAKHHARSLRVNEKVKFPDERPSQIPLAGRIAAGAPIEAVENPQQVDLAVLFETPHDRFILEVTGDSMIEDQIRPGDYVICEKRSNPHNGETVVALLEDGEATLKRYYRERNRVRLQPANPSYEPIFVDPDKLTIQGVVIGLVRKL